MSVHQISRRRLVQAAGAIASSAALPAWIGRAQAAEPFPSKPFKFVVPFPAGSGTDTTARLFGKALGDMSGQPVTVENRGCLLYTSPSPRDRTRSRMSSSA